MSKGNLKGKDLLLVLLYVNGKTDKINEPIIGKTRLTKMVFLFEKELLKKFKNINEDSLPEFFAYDYGPFSKELLDDIRFFQMIDFINEESLDYKLTEPEIEEYIYDINDDIGYGENVDVFDVDIPKEVAYSLTQKGIKFVEEKLLDQFNKDQLELLSNFKSKINKLSLNAILNYVYNKYPDSASNSLIKDNYIR